MSIPSWQLHTSTSAIVFDCDGTLTTIEGIDFLAKNNGVGEEVRKLTSDAMENTGLNPALYQERLDLVLPRREQVYALAYQYFAHKTLDVIPILQLLQNLNKTLYLVSAGLNPGVALFGEMLQIPREQIFAVDVQFDQQGNFLRYDKNSPLVYNQGKRIIIQELKAKHGQIIHIGDGLNDVVTQDLITRFIGYGGVAYRKNIMELCEYYINTPSLTPILPLILTQEEVMQLTPSDQLLYQQGLAAIQEDKVKIPVALEVNKLTTMTQSLQFE